jgi:Ca-activated chloride channel family protein
MLTLAHPWMLFLLPIPLLVRYLFPAHREPRQCVVVPFLARLAEHSGQRPHEGAVVMRGGWLRVISVIVAWVCAVVAMARPQIIEPPITKTVPVRGMVLAVDLSGSMETQDFTDSHGKKVDRLTAVKEVLDDFLSKRTGDRVGLIFFGTAPFVQAPFTQDIAVCRELLDEAQVKMAGPQTAFGDALGLAITMFDRSEVQERVMIALTDGNDTSSKVPPAKAAEIAKDKRIVIHTISVGDPRAAGEDALDVDTLKNVSATTGGIYAHAADRAQLDSIYRKLDAIETHSDKTVSHRPRRDVYWLPLIVGLATTVVQHALNLFLDRPRTRSRPSSSDSKSIEDEGRERVRGRENHLIETAA